MLECVTGLKSKVATGHHASIRLNPAVVWIAQGLQATGRPGYSTERFLERLRDLARHHTKAYAVLRI